MRNRLALLIAGALALLLGACNTQTQAPGGGEAHLPLGQGPVKGEEAEGPRGPAQKGIGKVPPLGRLPEDLGQEEEEEEADAGGPEDHGLGVGPAGGHPAAEVPGPPGEGGEEAEA